MNCKGVGYEVQDLGILEETWRDTLDSKPQKPGEVSANLLRPGH